MVKIEKYLTNKDIALTNDDIDTERLIKDLQNGMISESEANTRIENAKKEWEKESTGRYSELETRYNDLEKRNSDLTTNNAQLKLENVMTRAGFKQDDFKEVSQMRATLFANEKDDEVAISGIKEKFKSTYFPEENKTPFTPAPNESGVKGNGDGVKKEPIEINRNTSFKNFITITK